MEATASLGLEFHAQAGPLDALILPIGGGGLAAGVVFAMQSRHAALTCYGVEPEGAPTMTRALSAGAPVPLTDCSTLADSLAAPIVAPMSFQLCRERLQKVLLISDHQIVSAIRRIYINLRQTVEPSAAVSTAAESVVGRTRSSRLRRKQARVLSPPHLSWLCMPETAAVAS